MVIIFLLTSGGKGDNDTSWNKYNFSIPDKWTIKREKKIYHKNIE